MGRPRLLLKISSYLDALLFYQLEIDTDSCS